MQIAYSKKLQWYKKWKNYLKIEPNNRLEVLILYKKEEHKKLKTSERENR